MNPTPLTPITLEADETISSADAPSFWAALTALCPLPAGKTIEQISSGTLTVNSITKTVRVQIRFSS